MAWRSFLMFWHASSMAALAAGWHVTQAMLNPACTRDLSQRLQLQALISSRICSGTEVRTYCLIPSATFSGDGIVDKQ